MKHWDTKYMQKYPDRGLVPVLKYFLSVSWLTQFITMKAELFTLNKVY